MTVSEGRRMTNIPTELLRALIAVVDQRSFTKAANALGITQPAVSAQLKRLQFLLGCDVFDRSGHGIKLTTQGERVASYARRLLSINDQIVHIGGEGPRPELAIRVGTPSDFIASMLPDTLAHFRERWPDIRFMVRTGTFDALARDLRGGNLDILVGLTMQPPHDARHTWALETAWVRGLTTEFDFHRPVPLVSDGEGSVYHRLAVQVLKKAGLDWEDVFTGPSIMSLRSAVVAGFGVMPVIRRRANDIGLVIWDDAPLPKLPDLYSGIYVREGGPRAAYEQLADEIAAVLDPREPDTAKPPPAAAKKPTPVA
jgi:DNA-binding transcriptional LysR family regulator